MSPRCLDNRGFLLIETLVALMVFSIVVTMGLRFLLPMLHIQSRTSERVEMQQRSERLMEMLRHDIASTTPQALTYGDFENERLLAIQVPSDVQSNGEVIWASELVIYRWDASNRRLTRSIWEDERALLSTSGPSPISREELRIIAGSTTPSLIMPWVESFEIKWEDQSSPGFPLEVETVLKSSRGETRTFQRTFAGRLTLI